MDITLKSKHCLFVFLLFLICAVTYSKSLLYDFVLEDKDLIVNNPYLKDPRYLGKILTTDMYDLAYEGAKPNYYRPVEIISFMIDYKLWKLNPFGYHLSNLLIHFLNSTLAYVIIFLLFGNALIAIISSLLFCLHPINIAAVVFITGRSDLLAALFILSAFLCTILLLKRHRKWRFFLIPIALCALLAMLSRENAVFIPPGIFLVSLFIKGDVKRKIVCFVSAALMLSLALYFRIEFLHIPLARHDFMPMPLFLKGINFLYIIISFVYLLIMPVNLYLMHISAPIVNLLDMRAWIIPVVIFAIPVFCFIKRRNKILIFGILWFLIFSSQIFFLMAAFSDKKISMYEHWVYLASLGIYVIAANLFYLGTKRNKTAGYSLLIVILLALNILTQVNYSYYKDDSTLSKRILRFNPDNSQARKELAKLYLMNKQYHAALEQIAKALKIAPFDPDLYLLLGSYFEDTGRIDQAMVTYQKLLKISPDSARAINNLGEIYFTKGDDARAELFFKHAIGTNPLLVEPYLNIATLYARQNNLPGAIFYYKRAIQLNPDLVEGFVDLAYIYMNNKQPAMTVGILDKALASGHRDTSVLLLQGIANHELGFNKKAAYYFNKAFRSAPRSDNLLFNLGNFYANHGQIEKAIELWQKATEINPNNVSIKENINKARELLRQNK